MRVCIQAYSHNFTNKREDKMFGKILARALTIELGLLFIIIGAIRLLEMICGFRK